MEFFRLSIFQYLAHRNTLNSEPKKWLQVFATCDILKSMRREHPIPHIKVNGILIEKIIIDEHVDKHADHIDDSLILKVVVKLDGREFKSVSTQDEFEYFMTKVKFEENWYKLVWLLQDGCFYIGVITLFRDRRIE